MVAKEIAAKEATAKQIAAKEAVVKEGDQQGGQGKRMRIAH